MKKRFTALFFCLMAAAPAVSSPRQIQAMKTARNLGFILRHFPASKAGRNRN